jgi:hypothetical protein
LTVITILTVHRGGMGFHELGDRPALHNRRRVAIAHHTPLVQPDQPLRVGQKRFQSVLNHHHCDLESAVQVRQGLHDGVSPLPVQIRRGLIKDQCRRSHRQARGNGNSLLLSTGEMTNRTAPQMLTARGLKGVFHAIRSLPRGQPEIARPKRHFILYRPVEQLGGRVLEHQAHFPGHLSHAVTQGIQATDGDPA